MFERRKLRTKLSDLIDIILSKPDFEFIEITSTIPYWMITRELNLLFTKRMLHKELATLRRDGRTFVGKRSLLTEEEQITEKQIARHEARSPLIFVSIKRVERLPSKRKDSSMTPKILQLLVKGKLTYSQIAKAVGCSPQNVARVKKECLVQALKRYYET